MNINEFTKIKTVCSDISIDELKDKSDRTLMWGYDFDRNSFHVYIEKQKLHSIVYDYENNIITQEHGKSLDIKNTIPPKRAYPETCDYEFCELIKNKGYDIQLYFTIFDKERETEQFYGKRMHELSV